VLPQPLITVGHAGRYVLGECLRETDSDTVHLAVDSKLVREVVLKTVRVQGGKASSEALVASALARARAAARLNHPNIVTVYDAGSCEQGVYVTMERLRGHTLRDRLSDGWRPEPGDAARIARRIADALAHAHGAGVVHGRLEPTNIFMIGRTQLKLLNVGFSAEVAAPRAAPFEAMQRARVFDAAGWVAPERLLGEPAVARGDVYGLGLVLYALLTGRPAFTSESPSDAHRAVLQDDVLPVHTLNPAVPVALSSIVACAMARNPALRYRSARHMSNALRVYLLGVAGVAPRTVRPEGGARRAAALLAVIASAGLGVAALRAIAPPVPRLSQVAPAVARAGSAAALPPVAAASVAPAAEPAEPATPPAAGSGASAFAGLSVSATPTPPPLVRSGVTPKASKAQAPIAAARKLGLDKPSARIENESLPVAEVVAAPALAAPAASAVAASSAPSKSGRGAILLAVEPWGQVEVNGALVGTSPPMRRLTLPNGNYTVTIRNESFLPYSIDVNVSDGKPITISHRFGS
jgi:eukaryotic-like serine/threonine-protein kinase